MTRKYIVSALLAATVTIIAGSCKKYHNDNTDPTRNYFPLTFGKYVTYAVDSIYYNDLTCTQYRTKSQLKYAVTDTFTDRNNFSYKLSYIVDVFSRPYDGAPWRPVGVIMLNPTANGLNWTESNVKYVKMMFPVKEGFSWKGNEYAPVEDTDYFYLKDWNYEYRDLQKSYNTDYVNFDNTVTVLEDDEFVNYPWVDSGVSAMRNYSKSVYAYNVGLVYRELTHWTYKGDLSQCKNGYSVIMRALDHN